MCVDSVLGKITSNNPKISFRYWGLLYNVETIERNPVVLIGWLWHLEPPILEVLKLLTNAVLAVRKKVVEAAEIIGTPAAYNVLDFTRFWNSTRIEIIRFYNFALEKQLSSFRGTI